MPSELKPKKERNCLKCRFCKSVHANGQFVFLGCHHKPYKGKWIVEIKECPLGVISLQEEGATDEQAD